jgi:hypothetical protein
MRNHVTSSASQISIREMVAEIYLKKSDALVERVNTFIILHTKDFEIAFKIRNLWETFIFTNFKILSLKFCFWTPNYSTMVPSD